MSDRPIDRIALIGSGTIGASWAGLFAAHGLEARLYDLRPEARELGLARARAMAATLVDGRLCDPNAARRGLERLRACVDAEEALAEADFVQESVLERYGIKQEAHALIEAHAPAEAIVASSTSGLLASRMQERFAHPERFLIAHPFNPPHLVPLVELVPGPRTSNACVARTHAFYASLGKEPVTLNKEVPGHLANRLAAAVWREAIALVADGVASVEDVDKALHAGPGVRWAFMGQHLTYHLAGGDGGYRHFFEHLGPNLEVYFADLAKWDTIPDAAKATVIEGMDAANAGKDMASLHTWRDEKLIRVLRALAEA